MLQISGINGLIYGNVRGLEMQIGNKVVWYLLGLGEEVDAHTVHFHGTTVTRFTDVSHRSDVIGVFPGTSEVAEMIPHTAGTWLLHCHVNDHITAGMEITYKILAIPEPTVRPVSIAICNLASTTTVIILLVVNYLLVIGLKLRKM